MAMMLVVPPRRFATTLVELSRTREPPSARMVVTNPTRALAPASTIEPPLICRASRIEPALLAVSVQAPEPILVMLSLPEV